MSLDYGAYVADTADDVVLKSAGIKKGDVIISIGGERPRNFC